MNEDSQLLQQIISRYETEEEEFLREIESMQQCINTDTSDDMPDESPVLGTLCSLVGEIGQLRKENRKLRKKILENSASSNENTSNERHGVAFNIGSFLENKKKHQSSKPFLNYRKILNGNEIRTGARERLCSPTKKESLTTSSYSTDYSMDNTSRYPRSKVPPLVLPELTDSDEEHSVFTEVTLPTDNNKINNNTLINNEENIDTSVLRPRRSMMRRLHVSNHHNSDHISPSSVSASSSIEPPDTMSSSRASFLELIGIKRKNDRNRMSMPIPTNINLSSIINKKQRKRKVSENEPFDASSGSSFEKSKSKITFKSKNDVKDLIRKSVIKPSLAKSCKSLFEKHTRTQRFFDESEEETLYRNKKQRPKSVVYLETNNNNFPNSRIQMKTDSYKNLLSSRDVSEESRYSLVDWQCLQNENTNLKTEVKTLKTFSSKVANELKDKNRAYNNLEAKFILLEKEVAKWKERCQFNEAFEKLTLNEKFNKSQLEALENIEKKLVHFESEFKNIKEEYIKSQQVVINNTIRDQNAYQACIKQVERLQKENFDLLQLHASGLDLSTSSEYVKKIIEMMPSYDALYSFAIRISSKLTNLRKLLSEKCTNLNNNELEMLHLQTSLLLAHAQMERQKILLKNNDKEEKNIRFKRSHSFHGDSSITRAYKSDLNFYLPFKLHGNRVEQYKKAVKHSKDIIANTNEQNIEAEFLRLFDCARCVVKPFENIVDKKETSYFVKNNAQNIIMYRNGKDVKISPQNSPKIIERHKILNSAAKNSKNLDITINEKSNITSEISLNLNTNTGNSSSKRPISLIDIKEKKTFLNHKKTISNEEELLNQSIKPPTQNFIDYISPISTPIQSKKIYSSTIITENQITGSKQVERKLVKQKSLQQPMLGASSPILGKTIITKSYITEPSEYNALKSRLETIGNNQKDYNFQIPPKHTTSQQSVIKNMSQLNNSHNTRHNYQNSSTPSMIPTSPSIRRSHIISIKKPSKNGEKQSNNLPQNSHLLSQVSSVKKINHLSNTSVCGVPKIVPSSNNNSIHNHISVKDESECLNTPMNNVRNSIAKINAIAKLHNYVDINPLKNHVSNSFDKKKQPNQTNDEPQQQERVVKRAGTSWLSRLRPTPKK